ncbi:MAG: transcription-repair coupling factor [Limnochordales bacterium]|nr:transcription-repair coupling factor [Limnochordales bacterium]
MAGHGLIQLLARTDEYRGLERALRSGLGEQELTGLVGAAHPVLIACAYQRLVAERAPHRPVLVVVPGMAQAERMVDDLASLLGEAEVELFPPVEVLPWEETRAPLSVRERRLRVLARLLQKDPFLLVAPVSALLEPLLPADYYLRQVLVLETGKDMGEQGMGLLAGRLVEWGYERVPQVTVPGQFAIRGDILDVFPPGGALPVRIEFFGTEIDSLRIFDPESQRSVESRDRITLYPARETIFPEQDLEAALARATHDVEEQLRRLRAEGAEGAAAAMAARFARHQEQLRQRIGFPGDEQYRPYFFSKLDSLVAYLPAGAVFLVEPARLAEQSQATAREQAEAHASALLRGAALPHALEGYGDWDRVLAALKRHPLVYLSSLGRHAPGAQPAVTQSVTSRSPDPVGGSISMLVASLKEWQQQGYRIILALSQAGRLERLLSALRDEGMVIPAVADIPADFPPGQIVGLELGLGGGFELSAARLVVLTDQELLGRAARRRARRPVGAGTGASGGSGRLQNPLDLAPGDYVVHVNHGIGQFLGLETKEVAGVHRDYLVIKYAGGDKLYVPVEQVGLIQKYIGVEDNPPRLSRLGGGEWARLKKRVKESVKEVAEQLLRLYAERQMTPGYAFSPDTVWQREFEEAFQFEETPDQLRAVEDVKRDMESPRPMDRLLCGDVGYGKTEVAIRASFKAVADGKQVAVLVPTTILAQQHLRTFRERFSNYPVTIEALTRFQSPSEQDNILQRLKQGKVDIIIGTHRLLSKDVVFKDLGLVIIDEEQRFGVMQKERLKELRKSVDILTMTATPIPRTLHMALSGVRDMSVIETPPEDRYPVRTYVTEYSDELVKEAIERELARGGQVFVVINRVQGIEKIKEELERLVPQARVAVAHGQMEERRLEQVMLDFYEGEYDVLLCTTIIETGMDMPNVNTLIVLEADKLGLAQLYQLRGRVGRSNRVAYAYLTYRPDQILTEEAEKRLEAIREFTDLGSGFKIAMRDLEIRGAGNILGAEQHGFIAAVGFEMYNRMLEEAIRERRGEVKVELPEPVIDLTVDAYFSDEYVPDSRLKVDLYRRIVGLTDEDEVTSLQAELEDRFGPLPEAARNLLLVARLKVLARQAGVHSVLEDDRKVVIRFHPGVLLEPDTEVELSRRFRGRVSIARGRQVQITLYKAGDAPVQLLERTLMLVRLLSEPRSATAKARSRPVPAGSAGTAGAEGRVNGRASDTSAVPAPARAGAGVAPGKGTAQVGAE